MRSQVQQSPGKTLQSQRFHLDLDLNWRDPVEIVLHDSKDLLASEESENPHYNQQPLASEDFHMILVELASEAMEFQPLYRP
ncbi:hypothetical protein [Candidatus Leptofilum sp.]|uniref:hypothetical protein n=1 Tax=Candidatus Leptofilum sp. TaxID=3241576 RepID=UPI003B59EBA0